MAEFLLPPPNVFGLPPRYDSWRPEQDRAVLQMLDAPQRFQAIELPTAGGKSIAAVTAAVLSGKRVCILTHTNGLLSQYMTTLGDQLEVRMMADIRGQDNYPCFIRPRTSVKLGPCHTEGYPCAYMKGGCTYYDDLEEAKRADIVPTNYMYWMSSNEYSEGLGSFDILICDEADVIFDILSSYITCRFERKQVAKWMDTYLPPPGTNLDGIKSWAGDLYHRASEMLRALEDVDTPIRSPILLQQKDWLSQFTAALHRFLTLKGAWVEEWSDDGDRVDIHPVWPSEYAEQYLFLGIPKIILMSGTLSRKTVEMLKLGEEGVDWQLTSYPSAIPVPNRRVIYVPTSAMSNTRANYGLWAGRLDQILQARTDRRILIHTTSYRRSLEYLQRTYYGERIIAHTSGFRETEEAIRKYRSRPDGVLVSPSLDRGYDFPDDQCRCIVVGKVPIPDSRFPITRARSLIDPDFPFYMAMQKIQQEVGRSPRHERDWCEILIIDNDWAWFWPKYRHFASSYFQVAVEYGSRGGRPYRSDSLPLPPTIKK